MLYNNGYKIDLSIYNTNMNDLLNKLREQERSAFAELIVAPVLYPNSYINVDIAGVKVRLKVIPRNFTGFGKFRSEANKLAIFVDEPTFQEKRSYLSLLSSASLIVCLHTDNQTVGRFVHDDGRFDGTANICLTENISIFDVVDVVFDGNNFIYVKHNKSADYKGLSKCLREMLIEKFKPGRKELPKFWADAYKIVFDQLAIAEMFTREGRVKEAIRRAGGTFNKLVDRGNLFSVEFTVNGQKFSPVVNAETLRVESAGICLSGGDKNYDLQSLVHVAAGAVKQNRVVRGDYTADNPNSPYYTGQRNDDYEED